MKRRESGALSNRDRAALMIEVDGRWIFAGRILDMHLVKRVAQTASFDIDASGAVIQIKGRGRQSSNLACGVRLLRAKRCGGRQGCVRAGGGDGAPPAGQAHKQPLSAGRGGDEM